MNWRTAAFLVTVANAVDFFDKYMDNQAGPSNGYLDPSNPNCTSLFVNNPDANTNNFQYSNVLENRTDLVTQYATHKFVLSATDLCISGLLYESCRPLSALVTHLIADGVRILDVSGNGPVSASQFQNELDSAGQLTNIETASINHDGVLDQALIYPYNISGIVSAVQAVSFSPPADPDSTYSKAFHLHAIPEPEPHALKKFQESHPNFDIDKMNQGFKITFERDITGNSTPDDVNYSNNNKKSSAYYRQIGDYLTQQWLNATSGPQNYSNTFGYVHEKANNLTTRVRIEPMEYGFRQTNSSLSLCGKVGPPVVKINNSLSNNNSTIRGSSAGRTFTFSSATAGASSSAAHFAAATAVNEANTTASESKNSTANPLYRYKGMMAFTSMLMTLVII